MLTIPFKNRINQNKMTIKRGAVNHYVAEPRLAFQGHKAVLLDLKLPGSSDQEVERPSPQREDRTCRINFHELSLILEDSRLCYL